MVDIETSLRPQAGKWYIANRSSVDSADTIRRKKMCEQSINQVIS